MSVQDMLFTPALTFNEVIMAAQALATQAHVMGVADENDSQAMLLRDEVAPELLVMCGNLLEMLDADIPREDTMAVAMFRVVSGSFSQAVDAVFPFDEHRSGRRRFGGA